MDKIHEFFTTIDWIIVGIYLILTTIIGHLLKNKQSNIKDFFLAGRSLPWPAVSGSIIATEISGVTFIGVPGAVMALSGDFTYLQWAIGSIIARIIVGLFFVKFFYEKDIYSPYDFMGNRLGIKVKRLATILFTLGSILAQSVRVLVAALPLKIVTPLPFEWCICIIGLFAILWTLMGGMQTIIWTDIIQFIIFILGGLISLIWMLSNIDGGLGTLISQVSSIEQTNGEVINKLRVFNFSLDPSVEFTFWVAIIAVPFLNLNAFGVDQLNAQRMFCCKNENDAKKAIIWSSLGQLVTILMLFVGVALFTTYYIDPPTSPSIIEALNWENGQPKKPDNTFPVWIVTSLPVGLKGLILAGILAAAISSLDSILAALSQTSLSFLFHNKLNNKDNKKLLLFSRSLVIFWGVFLISFTFIMFLIKEKTNVQFLPLAFGMTSYTVGPLLGAFLVAVFGGNKESFKGVLIGSILSMILVLFIRIDLWILIMNDDLAKLLSNLFTYNLTQSSNGYSISPTISSAWAWPITTIITFSLGKLTNKISVKK